MSRPPQARAWLVVLAVSVLWVLPLWLSTIPPMVDYPQHLAMAAIVQHYHDPAWRFEENYTLALRHPNIVFELVVAGLGLLVPIGLAGKLVVSFSLAAVGPAAVGLARRAGRPDWYALLALCATYNYAFFWGFVGNLMAYPLMLAAVVLIDTQFERGDRRVFVSVALLGLLFYVVHLQFLFLFLGAAAWLLLAHGPTPRRLLGLGLAGLPAIIAAVLQVYVLRPVEWTPYQKSMREAATITEPVGVKISGVPECLFGARRADRAEFTLAALFVLLVLVLVANRSKSDAAWSARETLRRTRLATLASWFVVLYFAMPDNFVGTMVFQRLAPLAFMFGIAALPRPQLSRARLTKLLVGGIAGLLFAVNLRDMAAFEMEAMGLQQLIGRTAPGRNTMALVVDRASNVFATGPTYLHFPAMYQALKGGRLAFSFTELDVSIAQIRPEKRWDALLRRVIEWTPERFDFDRDSGGLDYFVVRGQAEVLPLLFKTQSQNLTAHSSGNWHLVERAAAP